ncbi:MAG TPA: penicillin-binding protein activator [Acidocella sp.]|nr:penicillin-binding protein activator [Acidocella sp.]HQU04005.1 penicillin-binding protein activator [Acidocella sp.]
MKTYLLRSLALLPLSVALAGCGQDYPQTATYNSALPAAIPGTPASLANNAAPSSGRTGGPVALLVPLTGDLAPVGQALENAAKLAFPAGGGPALDVRDTGGTAAGAASAAQAAIAAGDGIILGPLTSAEAKAVAPIAQAAQVNVLTFTNDSSVAAPGIWPLGISPDQQVARVVASAASAGRTQVAALLPDSDFGHSLATALQTEATALSEPSPSITFYQDGFPNLNQAVRTLSDFADRGQNLEAQIKAARELDTAAGREKARELQHQQIPPPAFNALFIGATNGDILAEIATLLPFYSVNQPQVQLLGPALWSAIAPALGKNHIYAGALYAAPDPASSAGFDQKYQSVYGAPPPGIADVGFDAAAIARLISGQGGYTSALLTDPAGFTGTDGVLRMLPNGQVQRGLAVFQVAPSGPVITSPAPTSLNSPSS